MRSALADFFACLSFYSRLPAPRASAAAAPDFSRIAAMAPFAGALLGALAALALLLSHALRLPGLVSAGIAICVLAIMTGALHEDGLADVADGFGGGRDKDGKLAIMRDSRLGSYGALALTLATILRAGALTGLIDRGLLLAATTLVFVGAFSRIAGLAPMLFLSPARVDGLGASAAPPTHGSAMQGLAVGAAFALLPWFAGVPLAQILFAIGAAIIGVGAFQRLAQRQIGGYTGDVLGAAQQVAEIALLCALSGS